MEEEKQVDAEPMTVDRARRLLKRQVLSTRWEVYMAGVLFLYFAIVFATFAVEDRAIARLICGEWITPECRSGTLDNIESLFTTLDIVFLSIFLIEIVIKLFALGCAYLRDCINMIDFVIIVVSMVMTILMVATDLFAGDAGGATSLLPLFRIVRLMRVVVVMTRLQRSRERYRRAKMVGFGAPVEKVFEIIADLRSKVEQPEDDKALAYTMDLIAKEELYKVSFTDSKSSSGMHLTAEMTDWLRSNLQSSIPGGKGRNSVMGNESKRGESKPGDQGKGNTGDKRLLATTKTIPEWITTGISEPNVGKILDRLLEWDFDIFELDHATNGNPLVIGGMHLLERMGVIDRIPIPRDRLATYLQAIEKGYVPSNPFHNACHASDVMFTTHFFLQAPLLRDMTGSLDKFAAVVAAAVHDYAHPGLSNPFLIVTRDDKAVVYNDQSVLEMFHVAGAFRVMFTTPDCDITEFLTRDQFMQFRETMVSMILATDLKTHFEHLGRLKTRVATDAYSSVERKDVLLLLGQALHAADISNPTKPRALMMRWTERVMKEFWQQGDQERKLGLPISAFMDRTNPQVPQCQLGFVNVLVKPLFVEWHKLLGETAQHAMNDLENSLKIWGEEGAAPAAAWDKEDFVRDFETNPEGPCEKKK